MPDITMCKGNIKEAFPLSVKVGVIKNFECPLKETCYRYKAKPDEYWQSYFVGIPYDKEKKDCEFYEKMQNR